MKRILSSLLVFLFTMSAAWPATQVIIDASDDLGYIDPNAGPFTISHNGITLDVTQGLWNGSQFRIYKGHSITICSSIGDITGIDFYCVGEDNGQYGPGNFTASNGAYACDGHIGSWRGKQRCVTFVATSGQVRINKIVVTVEGDTGILPPNIRPKSGTYYGAVEVSMACLTEGAKIYYTIDGSTPTANSTEYTTPFTLSQDATVKAISVKDDEVSAVVTAQYEIALDPCLSDLDDMPDGTVVTFNHPATVLYQYNNYLYLKDECGYGQVFGSLGGQIYLTGDVIPPGWGGIKKTYKGVVELANPKGFQSATQNEQISPELITIPMMGESTWAHYVQINGVYIDTTNQLLIDQQGNSCRYHPQLTNTNVQGLQNVQGIVTSYQHGDSMTYELLIIEQPSLDPPPVVCCLADLYERERNKVAEFECPLTAIYQNGPNLYVKDSCGEYGLIYGNNAGGPYENGDQIIGLASWTMYAGNKQVSNRGEWTSIGKTSPVQPIVLPIEEISPDMVHCFVKLENASLTEDNYELHIEDETGSILMYNKFHVEIIEDYGGGGPRPDVNLDNEVNIADVRCLLEIILSGETPEHDDDEGTYDIIGFITVYNGRIEIYPIKIVHHVNPYNNYDVNGDGEINIADVNYIIEIILKY